MTTMTAFALQECWKSEQWCSSRTSICSGDDLRQFHSVLVHVWCTGRAGGSRKTVMQRLMCLNECDIMKSYIWEWN